MPKPSTGQVVSESRPAMVVVTTTYPVASRPDIAIPQFVSDLCSALSDSYRILVVAPHVAGAPTIERDGAVIVVRFRYAPAMMETLAYCDGGMLAAVRKRPWRLIWLPIFLCAMALSTRRLVRRSKAGLVHAHWLFPAALAVRFAGSLQAKRPRTFVTSHGGDLHSLSRKGFRGVLRWLIHGSTGFAVVSPALAEKCLADSLVDNRPLVIPMGVDLRNTFAPRAAITRNRHTLLFVGRLVRKKGMQVLLEALAKLNRRPGGLRLRVIGDGPERSMLEQRAKSLGVSDFVDFLGWQPKQKLPEAFASATAAIVPSTSGDFGDREGLGLVAIEAMGCQCPVIVADYAEIRQLIRNGENGFLFREGDAGDLALVIDQVLSAQPQQLVQIGTAARASVLHQFDWSEIAASHKAWFEAGS